MIGYILGADISSTIIISAHYDHIGISISNNITLVNNGADDDSSGVACLLGLINIFTQNVYQPKNNLVFICFDGKEKGLWGSKEFCNSGLIDSRSMKLNLNFEVMGRSEFLGKQKFYITGDTTTNFAQIITDYSTFNSEWQLMDIGETGDYLFEMADNYSFYNYAQKNEQCIPNHTLATSVGHGYLHTPDDKIEYLDIDILTGLTNYLGSLIIYLDIKVDYFKCMVLN